MKIISQNGIAIYDGAMIDPKVFAEAGDPIPEDARIEYTPAEQRQIIRARINKDAGDTESLLGTTADGAQLAIYGLAAICAKLASANSLAEVREAVEPFAQLSAGFLAKVESGEVVLPFMLKGLDATVAEIETRATAVSDALQAAQKG